MKNNTIRNIMKNLNLPESGAFLGPALIWKRIAAFFIDMLIINLVVLFPFRSLFHGIVPKGYSFSEAYSFLSSSTNYTGFINSVSFVISVLIMLYFFMLERKMGQSIGKKLMGVYVVGDNIATARYERSEYIPPGRFKRSENKPIKPWQLLVRNLGFIPIFPFILLWVLDPLSMFFTKTNQRLTEILSRTKTVEKFSI